jgi:hypothetical protein
LSGDYHQAVTPGNRQTHMPSRSKHGPKASWLELSSSCPASRWPICAEACCCTSSFWSRCARISTSACETIDLTSSAADLRYLARLLYILRESDLQVVAVSQCHLPQRLLVLAQRHRVDQEQTFPLAPSISLIYWDRHTCTAILGLGDLCQFRLLPRPKQNIRDVATAGSGVSVSEESLNLWKPC